MSTPKVSCPACKGSGKVPLEEPLRTTYGFFPKMSTRLSAANVKGILESNGSVVSANAINNRLERLREMGLLMRERDGGRTWTYRRPKETEIEHDKNGQPNGVSISPPPAEPKPKRAESPAPRSAARRRSAKE